MTPEQMWRYGKGLGLWKDSKERYFYEPEPRPTFVDVPVYIIPQKGYRVEDPTAVCKPEVNPIANGVFIWTEIKGTGHAFVSVQQNNNANVYSYGRYGRRWNNDMQGDGILNFLRFEDARSYYREELYKMQARVFRIDDADLIITMKHFEYLWAKGVPAIQTEGMGDRTRRNGRTINQYDVTGKNCTTHTTEGIKIAGSSVFENGYTTNAQMRVDVVEDFAVPVSLQRYLIRKSAKSPTQVVEMTSEFRKQYPNIDGFEPMDELSASKIKERVAAEVASAIGNASSGSGGSFGGLLGGNSDVKE